MEEMKLFWFGVTHTFVCPYCSEPNQKLQIIKATTNNPQMINAVLEDSEIACRHCERALKDKLPVLSHVQPGTPEQLRLLGFEVSDAYPPLDS